MAAALVEATALRELVELLVSGGSDVSPLAMAEANDRRSTTTSAMPVTFSSVLASSRTQAFSRTT